ncbi:ABC transporter ATP-binding protein [Auraticoccus monumenti]|uniref:Energy-coupling factor transport system ATP-binding protein n=1 Tax=Auraticoccus monumenti TaxID=675864 RepID=A0A1G6XD06_9ACTN|nr:ABC transporter ATP-binding protein [Auraticoccus monumenti]SDD76048.1 energy-coupling factor transport system ATP-binding protein [Auraticoccus monumenti]
MLSIEHLSLRYPGADSDTLVDVCLEVGEGELALVVGRTGSGKSTLLGVVNNLVPRFTAGRRTGRVRLDGEDVSLATPRELADRVGWVGQDPLAGFVTDTVEEELAYGMEQLGVAPARMRARVEETLDLLGIADLRSRALRTLSGGQQQRVAIGSVLTFQPPLLVLDEPTSALDPVAAEEVVALLRRLVHDLGTTVLVAEHRMERVVESADRVVAVLPGGRVEHGDPATLLARAALVPPVVDLGRRLGWSPLPLDVRDARRHAAPLRRRLPGPPAEPAPATTSPGRGLVARGVVVRYGGLVAVAGVDLDVPPGQVCALMGRNGSGKSSLLWALHGAGRAEAGEVRLDGARARGRVALVPQTPTDLLYLETVEQECAEADQQAGQEPGTTLATLDGLVPGIDPGQHPRDLSEGQKLALVLALQLAAETSLVLLDEPTRGLDYEAKAVLGALVGDLAARGRSVLVATHDVEFVARTCRRVVVLAGGEVVSDGPTRDVLAGSALLATQVAKVMSPLPYLTVDEVLADVRALPTTGGEA